MKIPRKNEIKPTPATIAVLSTILTMSFLCFLTLENWIFTVGLDEANYRGNYYNNFFINTYTCKRLS